MNEESLIGASSLYSSTFAQVIFVNVEKQYTADTDVKCNYTLTPGITPHKNDWIGIFKVGWSTARDYHTFVWAPLPKEVGQVELQQQVTFEAYYLPKDDNDLYQFCYVTQKGEIRGASAPFGFQLANGGTPDRLESDSGQEMLVITTQEKLEEMEREKDELTESNQRLTTENEALKGKIKELEMQVEREAEEYSAALKMTQESVLELEKQVLEQKSRCELELKAQSEKEEQLREVLTAKEAACLRLRMEKQDLLAKRESSWSSMEKLSQRNKQAGEKLKQAQQEMERLMVEMSAKEARLTSLTEVKSKSANELKAAQEQLQQQKVADAQQSGCVDFPAELQDQVGDFQQCLKDKEKQVSSTQQQQAQTVAELQVSQASQEQNQKSLCETQQEIQYWKYRFKKVDKIFSKNEGDESKNHCPIKEGAEITEIEETDAR